MFDGTLGKWKGTLYNIHLKDDAIPYHVNREGLVPYHITTLERAFRGGHFGELKRGDQTFLGDENRLREQNTHRMEMDQTIYCK